MQGDLSVNRCPHCGIGTFEINGCMAVHCKADATHHYARRSYPGCGKHFCGFCFEKIDSQKDCHQHVKRCPANFNSNRLIFGGRDYFVSKDKHHQHWARVIAQRMLRRVESEPEGPLKVALMKRFDALYRKDL
ncbi:hypothetical protein CYMTET_18015 [Cymbomonas tetramitiformis]|uniref:Uncharacterized protein n=1 Tax=Cymbomonas tetramitiformis TaxID=36881 RepID=A0AAE0G8T1_9CHLO|nr:hypothetical protein CYMTET_18015 [Cymbomonas tetramitiformis]